MVIIRVYDDARSGGHGWFVFGLLFVMSCNLCCLLGSVFLKFGKGCDALYGVLSCIGFCCACAGDAYLNLPSSRQESASCNKKQ